MKIIAESHLDHGLTPAHIEWVEKYFGSRAAFFKETVTLPAELAPLDCALYGPCMGDDPVINAFHVVRGDRAGASRVIRALPRPTRLLTVIGGPEASDPCVLYTAFGGPSTPREPFDPSLRVSNIPTTLPPDQYATAVAERQREIGESIAFWEQHALAVDPQA